MTTEESNEELPSAEERKKLITAVVLGLLLMVALGGFVYSCSATSKLQGQVEELETELQQATQSLQTCQEDLQKAQKLAQANAERTQRAAEAGSKKNPSRKKTKAVRKSK